MVIFINPLLTKYPWNRGKTSERLPETGIEKHFIKVINWKARPCTPKEVEWCKYWMGTQNQNIKLADVKENTNESVGLFWDKQVITTFLSNSNMATNTPKKINEKIKSKSVKNNPYNPIPGLTAVTLTSAETTKKNKNRSPKNRNGRSSIGTNITNKKFNGGWTSLDQGKMKLGDSYPTQSIDKGISGTREENKKMRGQLWADIKKRGY